MLLAEEHRVSQSDLDLLRRLADRRRDISEDPLNEERRQLWLDHDAGPAPRPMVLIEDSVAFEQSPESDLQCQSDFARQIETSLRHDIYRFEVTRDDWVYDPEFRFPWAVHFGDYGVEVKTEYAQAEGQGNVASRHWDHPIKDLEADLHKLRPRHFHVDREETEAHRNALEDIFQGRLQLHLEFPRPWTMGLTQPGIHLIGLEQIMMAMIMAPEALHAFMAFLRDDHLALLDWLEREELLTPLHGCHYVGSGSIGLSKALPAPDHQPGAPLRVKDLWGLSESQETVGVGPDQFEEFIFPYQQPVIERYGRSYYGCCEPIHSRWQIVRRIKNLQRVSISPWCDQAIMAEALGTDYVFCRKPNPALISTDNFDEARIRQDLRQTLDTARGCRIELVMKDLHTVAGQPERVARWVEIAREEIAR